MQDRQHTDAPEQRRFLNMTVQEQLLEIYLNGRETNGHVADLFRWKEEIDPMIKRHDAWIARVVAVVLFILTAAPFVFFGLDHLTGK